MTPDDATPTTGRAALDGVLVAALARGLTYDAAADVAGCSPSTVDRRMRDPLFVQRVADARAERVERVADRLTALTEQAVDVLADLLTNGSERVRASIAQRLPALAAEQRDAVHLAARLAAVEQRLGLAVTPEPLRVVVP
jgi:methylphosphotriester-DNA--protein-cysteine methyltransferase